MRCVLSSLLLMTCLATSPALVDVPTDNPVARYQLAWTDAIAWNNVVNIANVKGGSLNERLEAAQAKLGDRGGVIYFPAGEYRFQDSLRLKNGVVLRGAEPRGEMDARKDGYDPPTRFEFPRYVARLSGGGTPTDTAFKGIELEEPATASNCGLVNLAINRGHVRLGEAEGHRCGTNRLVFGCVLRNTAVPDPAVPSAKIGQHPWQRFTARHHAAVHVQSAENVLIANNRLPKSGEDSFLQKGYVLEARQGKERIKMVVDEGVLFDYDNRPGLYINDHGIGAGGGNGPAGTPESHPWGFRKGTVIRDNYVYCSGRCPIAFSGDGTVCAFNVIRVPEGVPRWTVTGLTNVTGSGTNDNRAVQMRGYRWVVEGNDYVVHSNIAMPSKYRINDGEGLMHEAHVNSAIVDSKIIDNRGNAYISLYRVHGIDGLVIRGNHIVSKGKIQAIFALSGYFDKKFPCKNVVIEDNITQNSGILVEGQPAENNVVRDNRHIGPGGEIVNRANARLVDNRGYVVKKE